ncbi:hypothetical protein V2W45_1469860 [Cenococcum geophilum]
MSPDRLCTTRAIAGWCSVPGSLLGSEIANHENIDYSEAEDAANFTLGTKDGKCHFHRSGPYKRTVSAAEKAPVVLYDTVEKRAWLVPASSAMLHIAHRRNLLKPFVVDEVPSKSTSINLSDCEEYTFKDMIINIWSVLEDSTPGTTVTRSLPDVIRGYEFKVIVKERSPCRQKKAIIRNTNGGWPPFVFWQSVFKRKDYLATTVKILKDLYDVAGSRLTRDTSLFEPCETPGAYRCRCNRLQQIVPKSTIGQVAPP